MAEVVGSDTVVNPWAMAIDVSAFIIHGRVVKNLLIMLRNAASTASAMLASKWFSRHARDTEILLVKLPQLE